MAAARAAVRNARAHQRPAVLVDLHERLQEHLWLRLVGEWWARCEGDRDALVGLMRQRDDWQLLMTRVERSVLERMPHSFVVWRGCYRGLNEGGVSYTVDPDGARQYPFRGPYRHDDGEPVLLRAVVLREGCALKLDRGNLEVLVRKVEAVRVMYLDPLPVVDRYSWKHPVQPHTCMPGLCLRMPI